MSHGLFKQCPYYLSGPWTCQLRWCLCRVRKLSDFIKNIFVFRRCLTSLLSNYWQHFCFWVNYPSKSNYKMVQSGLGDFAQKCITIIFYISVDIDNYHDKCQIFIYFKFEARFLLQRESCRNQTIHFPLKQNKYLNIKKNMSSFLHALSDISNQETGLGCLIILIIIISLFCIIEMCLS